MFIRKKIIRLSINLNSSETNMTLFYVRTQQDNFSLNGRKTKLKVQVFPVDIFVSPKDQLSSYSRIGKLSGRVTATWSK